MYDQSIAHGYTDNEGGMLNVCRIRKSHMNDRAFDIIYPTRPP